MAFFEISFLNIFLWSNARVLPTVSLFSKNSGLAVFLALDSKHNFRLDEGRP